MFLRRIPHWRRPLRSLGRMRPLWPAALAALAAGSCIDRSNPFDPLNANQGDGVRGQLQPRLDSLLAGEPAYAQRLAAYLEAFARDSGDNAGRVRSNAERRLGNASLAEANRAAQGKNAAATADSLAALREFLLLDTLKAYGPYADFQERRTALRAEAAGLAAFIAKANADHSPAVVYPTAFSDSVFRAYARDTSAFAGFQARLDSGNGAVADTNAIVRAYNAEQGARNAAISAYNDSIAYLKEIRNRPVISKPESLTAATFVAKAGDTLYVGMGTYAVDLRFTYSGSPDTPIVVRGFPGGHTVLTSSKSSAAVLSRRSNIRFEDLVFRGAPVSGIKMESECANITFRRCRFEGNGVWGIEIIDSDADLADCAIVSNGAGARIQGSSFLSTRMRLQNLLVARNRGVGIEILNQAGEILNCTVSHNDSDGIRVTDPSRPLSIANTIVSSNRIAGIRRNPNNDTQDLLTVRECDVWGNKPGFDWYLPAMDSTRADALIRPNLSVDPGFTDPAGGDYTLKPSGVLAGYERQPFPIIIGYRP